MQSFLQVMYGNEPARWSDDLNGNDRLRFTINTLTRIRYLHADGSLEFGTKQGVDDRAARTDALVRCARPTHRRRSRSPSATGPRSA